MKKKFLLLFFGFSAISALLAVIYFYSYKTRNAIESLIADKKMINILVAGSNRYRDNRHSFYMIVSINPDNFSAGLTFIPPSFRIRLDNSDKKFKKISDIDMSDFNDVKNTFTSDLKLNVPFYIELYAPDVERFMDIIGGVNIYVLDQLKADQYFKSGENYLDGRKAIRYINSAEQNSIFLKYDRILDMLFTLYTKKSDLLESYGIDFLLDMLSSVKTNLLAQEIITLAKLVERGDSISATVINGNTVGEYYVVDDISLKIYEGDFYKNLIINSETDSSIKVKLLNGTSVPGLARKVRNNLIRDGLNVVEFGTYEKNRVKHSMIVNRRGNLDAVKKVSELSGISNIYHIIDSTQLNNVLIIIGEDIVK